MHPQNGKKKLPGACANGLSKRVGLTHACNYQHESRTIRSLVHGDDFASVGSPESLKWIKAKLSARFEIKTTTVGPNGQDGEVKEARILN